MDQTHVPGDANMTCRRWDGRAPMDIPARLMLTNGTEPCLLEDLSMGGARIALDSPPKTGAEGFLKFGRYEVFATVVWTRGGECGVEFERRLPKEVIIEMREFARNIDQLEASQLRNAAKGWSTGRAA
ncbi:MAG TPA: PilZ domain-containing protein [Alteraurantiacibacter sp.]